MKGDTGHLHEACQECGGTGGHHLDDCEHRCVRTMDCKSATHHIDCPRLVHGPPLKQLFKGGDPVIVVDRKSPFHNWRGEVAVIKPHRMHEGPGAGVIAWYYECLVGPVGGGCPPLLLTFEQDQLNYCK